MYIFQYQIEMQGSLGRREKPKVNPYACLLSASYGVTSQQHFQILIFHSKDKNRLSCLAFLVLPPHHINETSFCVASLEVLALKSVLMKRCSPNQCLVIGPTIQGLQSLKKRERERENLNGSKRMKNPHHLQILN